MNKSEQIDALAQSLSKLQGEINDIFKGKKGYGYNYADLASILDEARPLLAKHNLAISQLPAAASEMVTLETILMHGSGQWISSTIQMGVEKGKGMSQAQAVGSVITYARRYALTAILGIAQTDDDAAMHKTPDVYSILVERLRSIKANSNEVKDALTLFKVTKISELPESEFEDFMRIVQSKVSLRGTSNEGQ